MIETDKSIVPGYRVENVYVMAGVPSIMRQMLEDIIEQLDTGLAILSSAVHANVGEGEIAAALEKIQLANDNIDIGSYPQDKGSNFTEYRVIFVVRGTDQTEIDQACEAILAACAEGDYAAVRRDK